MDDLDLKACAGRRPGQARDHDRRRREAGCSQSTVSVVLNGTRGITISDETRLRVAEAVAALGYRRDKSCRGAAPAPARSP